MNWRGEGNREGKEVKQGKWRKEMGEWKEKERKAGR